MSLDTSGLSSIIHTRAPLVGRDRELGVLDSALEKVRSGDTRIWVDGEDITGGGSPPRHGSQPGTIDGDFREVDPEKDPEKNGDRKLPPRRP